MASQRVKKIPLLLLFLSLVVAAPALAADRAKAKTKTCDDCLTLKAGKKPPCHPRNYVDPKIAAKYNAAMRDLKRSGVQPKITSAWRSSEKQAALYKCSNSQNCRRKNPGLYYAKPPGSSAHEAGLAVDISGVAAGPHHRALDPCILSVASLTVPEENHQQARMILHDGFLQSSEDHAAQAGLAQHVLVRDETQFRSCLVPRPVERLKQSRTCQHARRCAGRQ